MKPPKIEEPLLTWLALIESPGLGHWARAWQEAVLLASMEPTGARERLKTPEIEVLARCATTERGVRRRATAIQACLKAIDAAEPELLDGDLRTLVRNGKRVGVYAPTKES